MAAYELAPRYYLALGLAIATTGTAYLLLRSPWSLGVLAVREDEGAANLWACMSSVINCSPLD